MTKLILCLLFAMLTLCSRAGKEDTTYVFTPEMQTAFRKFRQAMIRRDCNQLAAVTSFPITGDCGIYRILNDNEARAGEYNYQISKSLLLKQCNFLYKIESDLLKAFDPGGNPPELTYKDCVYIAGITVESKDSFTWSAGCYRLISEETGEYSIIFRFVREPAGFHLKEIFCAG